MAQVIKKIQVDSVDNPVEQAFYLSTSTGASDGTGLSTVAGNGNSGSYKSVRWYIKDVAGITAPYDGMRIAVKVPLNGVSTAGVILSINGNTDADFHPVAYNVNTVLTSHFPQNTIKVFTYDANQTMTCYKASNTAVTVTGVWKADSNYDSNTTITYGTLEYYFRPYNGANALYRYKFCALDKDNRIVPLTTTNVANGTAVTNITPTSVAFRPDKIWWYCTTTTISASALLGGQTLWRSGYNANNTTNGGMAVCNFNSTIGTYKLIYLCGTYDKTTGLFTLRGGGTAGSTQYYVQVPTNTASITLSSYFTSGYDYILLGGTYSSNNYIQLFEQNPMYHFDGTNLVPYDTYNDNRIEGLIPTDTNQTVKGNGTAFGANDAVNIVGGGNVTVTGDATNKSITISYTQPGSLKNPNPIHIYGETTKVLEYDGSASKSLYIKSSTTAGAFTVSDGTSSKLIQLAGDFTNTHYTSTFSIYAKPAGDVDAIRMSTFNQSANRSITFAGNSGITVTGIADSGLVAVGHANTSITAGTTQSVYSIKYDSYGHITAATAVTIPTNTNQTVKTSNVTFGANDVVEISAGNNVTVTGDATNKKITISATAPAATGWAGTLSLMTNSYTSGTQTLQSLYGENGHLDIGSPVVNIGVSEYGGMITTNYVDVSINAGVGGQPDPASNIPGSIYITANGYWYGDDTQGNIFISADNGTIYMSAYGGVSMNAYYSPYGNTSTGYISNAYISSAYISKLSVVSAGNQYIKGSTVSIYASQGGTSPAILLSASATTGVVSLYAGSSIFVTAGQSMFITCSSNLYISAGMNLSNGGVYISGSHTYISATNNLLNLSGTHGIKLICKSDAGSYVFVSRINKASAPVVAAWEHTFLLQIPSKLCVRFNILDRCAYAQVTSVNNGLFTNTTYQGYLSNVAKILSSNGFNAQSKALPCYGLAFGTNQSIIGIFTSGGSNHTNIWFETCTSGGYIGSSYVSLAGLSSNAGVSSKFTLIDTRRHIQD